MCHVRNDSETDLSLSTTPHDFSFVVLMQFDEGEMCVGVGTRFDTATSDTENLDACVFGRERKSEIVTCCYDDSEANLCQRSPVIFCLLF